MNVETELLSLCGCHLENPGYELFPTRIACQMNFPPSDTLEISATDTASLLREGAAFRLIDCREQDEWQLCRIDGAELVPLSQFAERAGALFTDPGERIVIHCHHGMRSAQAAHFLRQRGIPLAWSMAGGIEAWSCDVDASVPRY